MSEVKYNPGDIVELGGIEFMVLDNDYGGVGDLFILAAFKDDDLNPGDTSGVKKRWGVQQTI